MSGEEGGEMKLEDLLRLNADRMLHLADRVEKCTEAMNLDRQRRFEADVETDRREREWTQTAKEIARSLAVLEKGVDKIEDHTGSHPTHQLETDDSGKTPAGAARRAWRDFLRAPGRSQFAALALVALLVIAVLGYFAIRSGMRVTELERIHQLQERGP